MPMRSQKQRAWLHINEPEIAKEWEKHTPKGKKLPKKVKKECILRQDVVINGAIIPAGTMVVVEGFEPPPDTRFTQERPNISDQLAVGKDVYFYHPGLKQMHRGEIERLNRGTAVIRFLDNGQQLLHTASIKNIRKVFD